MCLVQLSTILCAARSRKTGMYRVWFEAERVHSPDYVFIVLVSIFIRKTHNHF